MAGKVGEGRGLRGKRRGRTRFIETAVRALAAVAAGALLWPQGRALAAQRAQDVGEEIIIVIDPGHGGENEGTIENGFQEKGMTLRTALTLAEELAAYDNCTVYLTRTEDVDLSLKERAEFAKSVDADFLFSIHYNASPQHNLFGSEVWIASQPPLNGFGYQYGVCQMEVMQDRGLFLRGVKTRLNDKGTDYYGIIREAAALGLPAAIVEHCHVDESRDVPFCDTEEKQRAFGIADAEAIARYFGLYSEALGKDYRGRELAEVKPDMAVGETLKDETPPDVCMIEALAADYGNGTVKVGVTAADYDSMLLYYDYSIDGGVTYSSLQPWPESDALSGSYTDTFSVDLNIPSGVLPSIRFRAYNLFDGFQESNELASFRVFSYGEENTEGKDSIGGDEGIGGATDGNDGGGGIGEAADGNAGDGGTGEAADGNAGGKDGLGGNNSGNEADFDTEENGGVKERQNGAGLTESGLEEVGLMTFLEICLGCVVVLFMAVFVIQGMKYRKRRKKRRRCAGQSRKVDGERRNQPR